MGLSLLTNPQTPLNAILGISCKHVHGSHIVCLLVYYYLTHLIPGLKDDFFQVQAKIITCYSLD